MGTNVGNVSSGSNQYAVTLNTGTQTTADSTDAVNAVNEAVLNPTDSYTSGTTTTSKDKSHVYDASTVQKLWDQANAATQSLRNIVSSMLGTKKTGKIDSPFGGKHVGEGVGQGYYAVRANPDQYGIKVPDDVRAEAQQMIGEDGYYGVKQTASRIMEFAKALGGENVTPDMIDELRKGAQQGFDDVAKMFGGFGNLPEVTQKTYEAVMKAFDDWKVSVTGSKTGETVNS